MMMTNILVSASKRRVYQLTEAAQAEMGIHYGWEYRGSGCDDKLCNGLPSVSIEISCVDERATL